MMNFDSMKVAYLLLRTWEEWKENNLESREARLWHGFWSCAQIIPGIYKPPDKILLFTFEDKDAPISIHHELFSIFFNFAFKFV